MTLIGVEMDIGADGGQCDRHVTRPHELHLDTAPCRTTDDLEPGEIQRHQSFRQAMIGCQSSGKTLARRSTFHSNRGDPAALEAAGVAQRDDGLLGQGDLDVRSENRDLGSAKEPLLDPGCHLEDRAVPDRDETYPPVITSLAPVARQLSLDQANETRRGRAGPADPTAH